MTFQVLDPTSILKRSFYNPGLWVVVTGVGVGVVTGVVVIGAGVGASVGSCVVVGCDVGSRVVGGGGNVEGDPEQATWELYSMLWLKRISRMSKKVCNLRTSCKEKKWCTHYDSQGVV